MTWKYFASHVILHVVKVTSKRSDFIGRSMTAVNQIPRGVAIILPEPSVLVETPAILHTWPQVSTKYTTTRNTFISLISKDLSQNSKEDIESVSTARWAWTHCLRLQNFWSGVTTPKHVVSQAHGTFHVQNRHVLYRSENSRLNWSFVHGLIYSLHHFTW